MSQTSRTRNGRKSTDIDTRRKDKGNPEKARRREGRFSKELRQKDQVVLKVGDDKVSVEKEVLVASSEYFKSLFSGRFADSNATEIDLTKDVEEIEDLKILLDFASKGEVEISENNLSQVFRVSSFFLVDRLTEQCVKFMSEITSLENCLEHYFIASYYAVTLPKQSMWQKLDSLVKARFHDFIIYQEKAAANIDDEELRQLGSSGILKYCSKESVFNFLLKWLSKSPELTDKQFRLVSDIVESFEHYDTTQTVPFQCDKKKTIASISRMSVSIRKSCDSETLQKFRQLFYDFLWRQERVPGRLNQHTKETCIGVFSFSRRTRMNKQSAKHQLNDSRNAHASHPIPGKDLASPREKCDVCLYQPDSRVWFHIASFDEEKYFSQVDGHHYHPTTQMLQQYPATIFCEMTVIGDEILFCDISSKFKLVKYNLKNKQWNNVKVNDIFSTHRHITNYQFESGDSGVTYLVTRTIDWAASDVQFQGYIYESSDSQLDQVFSTELVGVQQGDNFKEWSQMKVKFSSISNELIILCTKGVGDNLVLLVDKVKGGKPRSYVLLHTVLSDSAKGEELLFVDVDILETDDRFLVVSSANEFLEVKFQYKFFSKEFEAVQNGPKYKLNTEGDRLCSKGNRSPFRDSYWELDKEYDLGSHNRKINFSSSRDPEVEYHTPPPFVETVAVFATEVRRSMFFDLEPIRNFLEQ